MGGLSRNEVRRRDPDPRRTQEIQHRLGRRRHPLRRRPLQEQAPPAVPRLLREGIWNSVSQHGGGHWSVHLQGGDGGFRDDPHHQRKGQTRECGAAGHAAPQRNENPRILRDVGHYGQTAVFAEQEPSAVSSRPKQRQGNSGRRPC